MEQFRLHLTGVAPREFSDFDLLNFRFGTQSCVCSQVNPIEEASMTSSNTSELAEHFREQANWREGVAEAYPEDKRNAQSARALRSLAEYIDSGEAEARDKWIVQALEQHLWYSSTFGGQGVKQEVSRYGFGYEATNPHQHEAFLAELWVRAMEDAYDFAREHGEDATEALFPFEVEAAKDGVYLPSRYWQFRSGSAEHELEEAVESYRGDGEDSC